MAIGTDATVDFFGNPAVVSAAGGTGSIVNGGYAVGGDVENWTNGDDAPRAAFVLKCQFANVTDIGDGVITLHPRLMNIDGANDAPQPGVNYDNSKPIATFYPSEAVGNGTDMYLPAEGYLPNKKDGQVYEFYPKNATGQTISSGWTLEITPKTTGPKA